MKVPDAMRKQIGIYREIIKRKNYRLMLYVMSAEVSIGRTVLKCVRYAQNVLMLFMAIRNAGTRLKTGAVYGVAGMDPGAHT